MKPRPVSFDPLNQPEDAIPFDDEQWIPPDPEPGTMPDSDEEDADPFSDAFFT